MVIFHSYVSLPEGIKIIIWVCLKMLCTPFYPMVLLIIIPFLNGYFIGNIAYFQTKPFYIIIINGLYTWNL